MTNVVYENGIINILVSNSLDNKKHIIDFRRRILKNQKLATLFEEIKRLYFVFVPIPDSKKGVFKLFQREDYLDNANHIISFKGNYSPYKYCNLEMKRNKNQVDCVLKIGEDKYKLQFYSVGKETKKNLDEIMRIPRYPLPDMKKFNFNQLAAYIEEKFMLY